MANHTLWGNFYHKSICSYNNQEKIKIIPDERMNSLIIRLIDHYEKTTITKEK